jgi:hypothetical protein
MDPSLAAVNGKLLTEGTADAKVVTRAVTPSVVIPSTMGVQRRPPGRGDWEALYFDRFLSSVLRH